MRERLYFLSTFTPDEAAALPGPAWLQERRAAAAETFSSLPLPTEKDEVWRYSRIDRLELDRFHPAGRDGGAGPREPVAPEAVAALADRFGPRSALVVTVDGILRSEVSELEGGVPGIRRLAQNGMPEEPSGRGPDAPLGSVVGDPHEFVLLNDAFAVEPLMIDVPAGSVVGDPVVVVHVLTGSVGEAVFPRTFVRAGPGSRSGVVEIIVGAGTFGGPRASATPPDTTQEPEASEHLVVPVTEVEVSDDATLSFVSVQSAGPRAWVLAHQASRIGSNATLQSFAVALGGGYARLRTDSALAGESGTSLLRAAFVGRDEQMLDFRTLQDHLAPRTTSDLLFMGAVADHSHSVYSGLIRVQRGAVRSDAMQTNHNLVLDEGAHADSVPNLDIQENDVRCSHGSTVGPVDEDQRYYLESRGVEPEVAERLIVAGFFDDIAMQVPIPSVRPVVGRELAERTGAHSV